jgi:hypothetical protein
MSSYPSEQSSTANAGLPKRRDEVEVDDGEYGHRPDELTGGGQKADIPRRAIGIPADERSADEGPPADVPPTEAPPGPSR